MEEDFPMRAVVQRILRASVTVDGKVVGNVDGPGLLVYLGVTHTDGPDETAWTAPVHVRMLAGRTGDMARRSPAIGGGATPPLAHRVRA